MRHVAPLLLIVLFTSLLVQLPMAIADRAKAYDWWDPIQDVRRTIVDSFVEEPDEPAMHQAMIDAMIDVLGDPYTVYIPPAEVQTFDKELHGSYAGIGAEVNISEGFLQIVSPMDDSPALKAGVLAGDLVTEIEGDTTRDLSIEDCIALLTGEAGTPVNIKVLHLDGEEENITIVRDHIVTQTVKGLRRVGEDWNYCADAEHKVFYIRLTQFNATSADGIREALHVCDGEGMEGLVLDLRDNPGGGLGTAVAIANLFLTEGIIVKVTPRVGETVTHRVTRPGAFTDFPMTVLVNGNSASASEIVAGALQENHRATVIGTRSFGKGSVQEVRNFDRGGKLKLTTAHYYLAGGRNLNRKDNAESWGVDPDPGFVIPVTDEEYVAWARARRDIEIIRDPVGDESTCGSAEWVRENLKDKQLAAAIDAVTTRLQDGAWVGVSEAESGAVAISSELRRAAQTRSLLFAELQQVDKRIAGLIDDGEREGIEQLFADETELDEGTIAIHDRNGKSLGTFRVKSGDLELALTAVKLERLDVPAIAPLDPASGEPADDISARLTEEAIARMTLSEATEHLSTLAKSRIRTASADDQELLDRFKSEFDAVKKRIEDLKIAQDEK